MSDLTLVSGSEFEYFLSVECDWISKISQRYQFGFLKEKIGFSSHSSMISVNVEAFVS